MHYHNLPNFALSHLINHIYQEKVGRILQEITIYEQIYDQENNLQKHKGIEKINYHKETDDRKTVCTDSKLVIITG